LRCGAVREKEAVRVNVGDDCKQLRWRVREDPSRVQGVWSWWSGVGVKGAAAAAAGRTRE